MRGWAFPHRRSASTASRRTLRGSSHGTRSATPRSFTPGDAYSYDIFTQAARAVGPDRGHRWAGSDGRPPGRAADCSRRFPVRRPPANLHQRGTSPDRCVRRLRAVYRFRKGRGIRIGVSPDGAAAAREHRSGADLDVPVIVVNSRDGGDQLLRRCASRTRLVSDSGRSRGHRTCPLQGRTNLPTVDSNWLSYAPVYSAAIRHLNRWITEGVEPPRMPRVEVKPGATRPEVVRDEHGNAVGGIRLPDIDVPTASPQRLRHAARGLEIRIPVRQRNRLQAPISSRPCIRTARPTSKRGTPPSIAVSARAWSCPRDAPALRARAASWATRLDN